MFITARTIELSFAHDIKPSAKNDGGLGQQRHSAERPREVVVVNVRRYACTVGEQTVSAKLHHLRQTRNAQSASS
jgi:hypothetical protein